MRKIIVMKFCLNIFCADHASRTITDMENHKVYEWIQDLSAPVDQSNDIFDNHSTLCRRIMFK